MLLRIFLKVFFSVLLKHVFTFGCPGSPLPCGLSPAAVGGAALLAACGPLAAERGSGTRRLQQWPCPGSVVVHGQASGCRARLWDMQASAVAVRGLGSVVHGLSCSTACGIFPDQGSNPCPLNWQVDSYALSHQRSPRKDCFVLPRNMEGMYDISSSLSHPY